MHTTIHTYTHTYTYTHTHIHTHTGTPQPPSILQHPTDVILASAGLTATFTCSASGEPTPTFTWTHNGTQLPSPQGLGGTSILNVTNVQIEDAGTYTCMAINSQGTAISDPAQLQLACKYKNG